MSFPKYPACQETDVEWLGQVPAHWTVFALKRSVEGCVNGIWGNEPDGSNDIVVIRVADFNRAQARVDLDKLTLRSVTPTERVTRLLRSGDLLIEKSGGGDKTLVGSVVLFDHEFDAVTSNFVARMRPLDGFDSGFLCYAFQALFDGRVNYPSVKQTTGIQNLDSEAYLQERFSFPPPHEQVKIARFLDHETSRIDALIAEQQRLIELLKEKRQAVISQAVTKGLDPSVPMKDSGVEWLGATPEHWTITPLKHHVGLNPSKTGEKLALQAACSFVPMEKLKLGSLELDEIRTISDVFDGYTYFQEGDLLQAKVTPCFENMNMAIAEGLVGGVGFGSTEINVLRTASTLSTRFLYYRLQEDAFMEYGTSSMIGAGGLKRVPSETLRSFSFGLPPLDEQQRIADYLDEKTGELEDLTTLAHRSIELLSERRSALISAAVTGKIDVRNWQPPLTPQTARSEELVAHG